MYINKRYFMWQISYALNDNGSFETQSVQGKITRRILKYARTCAHCIICALYTLLKISQYTLYTIRS